MDKDREELERIFQKHGMFITCSLVKDMCAWKRGGVEKELSIENWIKQRTKWCEHIKIRIRWEKDNKEYFHSFCPHCGAKRPEVGK